MATLLIVDDDARIQELLRRFLQPLGHELRFAEDANAALASMAEQPPAVVLCDIHMPGANGLWLADRIRAIAPATAIVLATGDANVPPIESLRRGVVAYVLKPFDRDQLVQSVRDGLAWSQQARRQQMRLGPGDARRLPAGGPQLA